jgi:hypothetical protein
VGSIGDADDEGVDNRGYCGAPLGFQRHWLDYPGKSRAEKSTVDPMDHLGVSADVFTVSQSYRAATTKRCI